MPMSDPTSSARCSRAQAAQAAQAENNVYAKPAVVIDAAHRFRSRGPNYPPDDPIPVLLEAIATLRWNGRLSPVQAAILVTLVEQFRRDRWGQWRTPQAVPYRRLAELVGCTERAVKTALALARVLLPWLRSWRTTQGNVYAANLAKCDVECEAMGSKTPDAKKINARPGIASSRISLSSYSVGVGLEEGTPRTPLPPPAAAGPPDPVQAARLASLRADPEAQRTIAAVSIEGGMPGRLALEVLDRFVSVYTARPERVRHRGDLLGFFLSETWLQRDIARFVAKHGPVVGPKAAAPPPRAANDDAPPCWYRTSTMDEAKGRWRHILTALGVDEKIMNGKHQPCPICGGKDRFRYDDNQGDGNYFCNRCSHGGTGIKLLMGIKGWDFKRAADEVDQVIGRHPHRYAHRWMPANKAWPKYIDDDMYIDDDDIEIGPGTFAEVHHEPA
jgi:hypothetical protein